MERSEENVAVINKLLRQLKWAGRVERNKEEVAATNKLLSQLKWAGHVDRREKGTAVINKLRQLTWAGEERLVETSNASSVEGKR